MVISLKITKVGSNERIQSPMKEYSLPHYPPTAHRHIFKARPPSPPIFNFQVRHRPHPGPIYSFEDDGCVSNTEPRTKMPVSRSFNSERLSNAARLTFGTLSMPIWEPFFATGPMVPTAESHQWDSRAGSPQSSPSSPDECMPGPLHSVPHASPLAASAEQLSDTRGRCRVFAPRTQDPDRHLHSPLIAIF
jgi:hypothetical protein